MKSVAVVGASGAVGEVMIRLLEERRFPVGSIKFLASERSAGKSVTFAGETYPIEPLAPAAPVITGLTSATDSGRLATDMTTKTASAVLVGTAEPGMTIQVLDGATVLGTTTANATTGAWSYTLPAAPTQMTPG